MASKSDKQRREIKYGSAHTAARRRIEDQSANGALKIPEGLKVLEVEDAGAYNLDIVPYIAGRGNPSDGVGEGTVWYERTYWAHAKVGPDEKMVCCLRKNWGERCPLCDRAEAYKSQNDMNLKEVRDAYNSMKAKLRQLFLVIERRQKSRHEPELQLFDYSYHGFGKQLDAKLDATVESLPHYGNFFHLEDGMTVQAQMSKTDMGKWLQASNIELIPRKEPLPESLLDDAPCLDDMPIRLTQKQIEAMMEGEKVDEEPARATPDRGERPSRNGHDEAPAREPARFRRPANDEPQDDDRPSRAPARPTAREEPQDDAAKMGLEEGVIVLYKKSRCKVLDVYRSGRKVDLEDCETTSVYEAVPVSGCSIPAKDEEPVRTRRAPKEDPPEDDDRPRRTGRSSREEEKDPDADKPAEEDDDRPRRQRTRR